MKDVKKRKMIYNIIIFAVNAVTNNVTLLVKKNPSNVPIAVGAMPNARSMNFLLRSELV